MTDKPNDETFQKSLSTINEAIGEVLSTLPERLQTQYLHSVTEAMKREGIAYLAIAGKPKSAHLRNELGAFLPELDKGMIYTPLMVERTFHHRNRRYSTSSIGQALEKLSNSQDTDLCHVIMSLSNDLQRDIGFFGCHGFFRPTGEGVTKAQIYAAVQKRIESFTAERVRTNNYGERLSIDIGENAASPQNVQRDNERRIALTKLFEIYWKENPSSIEKLFTEGIVSIEEIVGDAKNYTNIAAQKITGDKQLNKRINKFKRSYRKEPLDFIIYSVPPTREYGSTHYGRENSNGRGVPGLEYNCHEWYEEDSTTWGVKSKVRRAKGNKDFESVHSLMTLIGKMISETTPVATLCGYPIYGYNSEVLLGRKDSSDSSRT